MCTFVWRVFTVKFHRNFITSVKTVSQSTIVTQKQNASVQHKPATEDVAAVNEYSEYSYDTSWLRIKIKRICTVFSKYKRATKVLEKWWSGLYIQQCKTCREYTVRKQINRIQLRKMRSQSVNVLSVTVHCCIMNSTGDTAGNVFTLQVFYIVLLQTTQSTHHTNVTANNMQRN